MQREARGSRVEVHYLEALYFNFLKSFYEDGDRKRARKIAPRLEAALAASPGDAAAIRGDEIRSLLAELREDYAEAARSREAEIRKIFELHCLTLRTPSWDTVARHYDFSDLSDRLDLLALLYDKLGELDRAIATLVESKNYCQSHKIPFDGQDILDELEEDKKQKTAKKLRRSQSSRRAG